MNWPAIMTAAERDAYAKALTQVERNRVMRAVRLRFSFTPLGRQWKVDERQRSDDRKLAAFNADTRGIV